jgi:hypothetical protein
VKRRMIGRDCDEERDLSHTPAYGVPGCTPRNVDSLPLCASRLPTGLAGRPDCGGVKQLQGVDSCPGSQSGLPSPVSIEPILLYTGAAL